MEYVKDKARVPTSAKVLLGVSGGLDSMVMVDLFHRAGFETGIAHCNFQLRGLESDEDEAFVKEMASQKKIRFYTQQFDTRREAEKHSISIQMAARKLRMEWFAHLCQNEGFTFFALAHHRDDEHETFFINLMRGTGIAGLRGLLPRNGKLLHPLLFATRDEIKEYSRSRRVSYREDSSNKETNYLRNKIRHQLLPVLEEIKPGSKQALTATIQSLKATETIYRHHLEAAWKQVSIFENELVKISIPKLLELPETGTYLFEFLSPYGYNAADASQVEQALNGIPGKQFFSLTHRLVVDRDTLLIELLRPITSDEFGILKTDQELTQPIGLSIKHYSRNSHFKINEDESVAQLDEGLLMFPLILRKWKKGDYFYPLGLKGRKLLSDWFNDRKFSRIQKENCWILCSGDAIVWITGHQLDDRFKIRKDTQHILEIRLNPPYVI